MGWIYSVVPFEAQAGKGVSFQTAAAKQFWLLLKHMDEVGYEYYRMDNYNVREKAGCLAALLGQGDVVVTYNVAVFRKPSEDEE